MIFLIDRIVVCHGSPWGSKPRPELFYCARVYWSVFLGKMLAVRGAVSKFLSVSCRIFAALWVIYSCMSVFAKFAFNMKIIFFFI